MTKSEKECKVSDALCNESAYWKCAHFKQNVTLQYQIPKQESQMCQEFLTSYFNNP